MLFPAQVAEMERCIDAGGSRPVLFCFPMTWTTLTAASDPAKPDAMVSAPSSQFQVTPRLETGGCKCPVV